MVGNYGEKKDEEQKSLQKRISSNSKYSTTQTMI